MARLFEYAALVRTKTKELFVAAHPHGLLLLRLPESGESAERGFKTQSISGAANELVRAIMSGEVKLSSDASQFEVYALVKKPDSPWAGRISIGRTRTNDIEINDGSVSKLHAYISVEGAMTLTDANSRNGVTLKGQKLAPSVAAPLASGDTFILGTLAFVYYSGAAFYDFVKKDILKQG
jgi:hypothetical protein